MAGRPTFTIVLSRPTMNRLMQQMASMRARRRGVATASPGTALALAWGSALALAWGSALALAWGSALALAWGCALALAWVSALAGGRVRAAAGPG
jgi:hypothetical protein